MDLVEEITGALNAFSSEQRKEKSKTYCPSAMQILGVNNPDYQKVFARFWPEMKILPPVEAISLASKLAFSGIFENRQFAWELLWKHKPAQAMLRRENIEVLGEHNDNWVSVDTFSVYVSGPAWRFNQIDDDVVKNWTHSSNRWWRRTALVSTVPLNLSSRGGKGDLPRTLMIAEILLADRDEMVVKALSWALREASKKFPVEISHFIEAHRSDLAGRVLREVTTKLTTGRKNG